jgi:hypothetical protein
MKGDTVLRKNPNVVSRVIADETVLLPIYRTSKEINCIYTLNKSASRIWELIDGKRRLDGIRGRIAEEFAVTEAHLQKELGKVLSELLEIKAVTKK